MSAGKMKEMVKDKQVKSIDLWFTDIRGKDQHITVWLNTEEDVDNLLKFGKAFDGASMTKCRVINNSEMLLMPDPGTATFSPFLDEPTLILRCDILDPRTLASYERDPRSVAQRAEAFLKQSGIADVCYLGNKLEFFILDHVAWQIEMNSMCYRIDSKETSWNCITDYTDGSVGYQPRAKGSYFPVPSIDSLQDIRATMCMMASEMGLSIETHHHEVAAAGQGEISVKFNSVCKKGDETQILKHVICNVAHAYGKTATFMPKPLMGNKGNGMHCHMSLFKEGQNLFSGTAYAGLSQTALYFIGGIIKHARSLNAFTNPTTNSYKRLVPGFEVPTLLAYSACNRSAAIRIPYVHTPNAQRIEVRFPDSSANPYFAFAALLMAGLDGIDNNIEPGEAIDHNLYALCAEKANKIPTVCSYLDEALEALEHDQAYLLQGGVFTQDLIHAYILLKKEEVMRLRVTTHPIEFDMYYSI